MNAIIVMLVSAVVATPFLALSGTSAPAPQIVRRFGAIAPVVFSALGRKATGLTPGRALAHDLATPFVAGNVLFVHTADVAAPTAGRGLAQPAV